MYYARFMRHFLRSPLRVFLVLVLFASLPLTVLVAQKQQELRQRAYTLRCEQICETREVCDTKEACRVCEEDEGCSGPPTCRPCTGEHAEDAGCYEGENTGEDICDGPPTECHEERYNCREEKFNCQRVCPPTEESPPSEPTVPPLEAPTQAPQEGANQAPSVAPTQPSRAQSPACDADQLTVEVSPNPVQYGGMFSIKATANVSLSNAVLTDIPDAFRTTEAAQYDSNRNQIYGKYKAVIRPNDYYPVYRWFNCRSDKCDEVRDEPSVPECFKYILIRVEGPVPEPPLCDQSQVTLSASSSLKHFEGYGEYEVMLAVERNTKSFYSGEDISPKGYLADCLLAEEGGSVGDKYRKKVCHTDTAKQVVWTYRWRNCLPNDCTVGSNVCNKSLTFTVGGVNVNVTPTVLPTQPVQPTFAPSPTTVNLDLDRNGLVDILDYNFFSGCFAAQSFPLCEQADLDGNSKIDIEDYKLFYKNLPSP